METHLSVKRLPPEDRPRERLYHNGPCELSLQELLAIVLGRGTREASALGLAFRLLERYGDIVSLGRANLDDLKKVPGIGFVRACQLVAAFEIGKRFATNPGTRGISIHGPGDIARMFMHEMTHLDREHFKAALLNTKNQVLKVVTISIGSLNASIVHPREIFKPAISASAASIVLVHNHPTGDPTPSQEDVEFTRRFAKCGDLMGIQLLDHVIIGWGRYRSLKESGAF
ncbi:MAG: DNA repair protein RadC [Candidatus Krumholzibacteria bacterium]|nr:DNA repair protein RadC [Candidatus Krumholzibacteria bacterium]